MFDTSVKRMPKGTGTPKPFDPATLGDPLALEVDWTPTRKGGSDFRSHKLVEIDSSRMEFRITIGGYVIPLILLLMGIGAFAAIAHVTISSRKFEPPIIIFAFLGTIFSLIGWTVLRIMTNPVIFDKRKGLFWNGRSEPNLANPNNQKQNFARLDEIHALQIISELCTGKNSFYSYELNLILKNGDRINAADHGNLKKLRNDAVTLSTFLQKPIWDATI